MNYPIQELMNDQTTWMFLMKYFFDILMTQKSNQGNDGILLVETWKEMAKLLDLDIQSYLPENDDEEMIMESQFTGSKKQDLKLENLQNYRSLFVSSSVDFVNNFPASSKNTDNVRLLLKSFFNFHNYFFVEIYCSND